MPPECLASIGVVIVVFIAGIPPPALYDTKPDHPGVSSKADTEGLAVHSMIDHLYEFPLVTLAAGFVLGWASRPGKSGVVSAGAVHG